MKATLTEILGQMPTFRGLAEADIIEIAAIAVQRKFAKNEVIFLRGDSGDGLYGIISGEIRVVTDTEDGKEHFLNTQRDGDIGGEIALFDAGPRTATWIANKPTTTVFIERRAFLRLLMRNFALIERMLTLLCERVRWTSEALENSLFLSVPQRLAKWLLDRASVADNPEIEISQADLALFLSASRQAVNQHLQEWQRGEIVTVSRNHIRIVQPGRLRGIVRTGDVSPG